MPVYLVTVHAYGTWSEDHRSGYVQRADGLKPPSERQARWRREQARHDPAEFTLNLQAVILTVAEDIARERDVTLRASTATKTHAHELISFRSPACTCGASEHCRAGCTARAHAEAVLTRMKQKMGQAIAKHEGTKGRPWFSRGWDLTPVRDREHFDHHLATYLPKHATREGGAVKVYTQPRSPGCKPGASPAP